MMGKRNRSVEHTVPTDNSSLVRDVQQLLAYRELIRNLVLRDLKVRYKKSALGFVWSLLNPLFMMVILTVVFSTIFGRSMGAENFPAFLVVGLLAWNYSSTALSQAVSSVVDNAPLIKKAPFPHEVLPISTVIANFAHFLLALPVLIVILAVLGVPPTWYALLLPLLALIQLTLIAGLALIISCINVFFRDMGVALGVLLQGWFFLTPIIYHPSIVPSPMRWLLVVNPLAPIINAYRDVLISMVLPSSGLLLGAAISLALFTVGYLIFRKCSSSFVEEL